MLKIVSLSGCLAIPDSPAAVSFPKTCSSSTISLLVGTFPARAFTSASEARIFWNGSRCGWSRMCVCSAWMESWFSSLKPLKLIFGSSPASSPLASATRWSGVRFGLSRWTRAAATRFDRSTE